MCSFSKEKPKNISITSSSHATSKRLLSLRLSSLGRSLPIAPDHHHAQEASDHSAAEKKENDRDANGPDAGREEGLDEVRVVDEGLWFVLVRVAVLPILLCFGSLCEVSRSLVCFASLRHDIP
jgi:hypothetical protein